jgi:hypothetical protein
MEIGHTSSHQSNVEVMGAQYPSSLGGGYGIAGSHGNEDLNGGCVVMLEQRLRGVQHFFLCKQQR